MFDKTLFVTDNLASPAEWTNLQSHFAAMLAKGLNGNSCMERFTKFGHYDAYGYILSPTVFTPNDLRKRIYSPEYMAKMEAQFNVKLTKEGIAEYHYHLPGAKAGYAHTDEQRVGLAQEFRTEEPCKGIYFYNGKHNYRLDEKMPLSPGCVSKRRIIGNIMYLNDDYTPGHCGQTAFFTALNKKYDPVILVDPLPNRVVTFLTDSNSWHASMADLGERKTLVWWYHAD